MQLLGLSQKEKVTLLLLAMASLFHESQLALFLSIKSLLFSPTKQQPLLRKMCLQIHQSENIQQKKLAS